MFDKLIESNTAAAEFKPRRKFFMVSSVVVGIAFLSAVVFSLYAQDLDLGTDSFEFAELIAPIAQDAPEPEPPRQQPRQSDQTASELPIRPTNMARVDEAKHVPDSISTDRNTEISRPPGDFILDPKGTNSDGVGRPDGTGNKIMGSSSDVGTPPIETAETRVPPPIVDKPAPPKRTVSLGPVNGIAKYLPKPPYPAPALAVRAGGPVTVQVTIDEDGKVISAKAVSGHPFLRGVSEKAAWSARFTPTLLSNVPVKVTGVITYNFTR